MARWWPARWWPAIFSIIALAGCHEAPPPPPARRQRACLAAPSRLAASCASSGARGAHVAVRNELPFAVVLGYVDSAGREHARYAVPALCARLVVAAAGSAWRARPAPRGSALAALACGGGEGDLSGAAGWRGGELGGWAGLEAADFVAPPPGDADEGDGAPSRSAAEFFVAAGGARSGAEELFVARGLFGDGDGALRAFCSGLAAGGNGSALAPAGAPGGPAFEVVTLSLACPAPAAGASGEGDAFDFPTWVAGTGVELDVEVLHRRGNGSAAAAASTAAAAAAAAASGPRPLRAPRKPAPRPAGAGEGDEYVREVLEEGWGGGAREGAAARAPGAARPKASLSLRVWKVEGSAPTARHEGLKFTIKAAVSDFLRPRRLRGTFERSERCPLCNWDHRNETLRAEVEGDYASAPEPGARGARWPLGAPRTRLATCPRCDGSGFLEASTQLRAHGGDAGDAGGAGGAGAHAHPHAHSHSFAEQRLRATCPSCRGVGSIAADAAAAAAAGALPPPCSVCRGERFVISERAHTAELPAGLRSDWLESLERLGGETAGRAPGALVVELQTELGAPPRGAAWADEGEALARVLKLNVTRVGALALAPPGAGAGAGADAELMRERARASAVEALARSARLPAAAPAGGAGGGAGASAARYAGAASRAALELLSLVPANSSLAPQHAGPHLLVRVTLSLDEAVSGFRLNVATLRHEYATLRVHAAALPVMPGDVFVVPGGGLPIHEPGRCVWGPDSAPCAAVMRPDGSPEAAAAAARAPPGGAQQPWDSVCDFSGAQAERDCPLEPLRGAWTDAYTDYANACDDAAAAAAAETAAAAAAAMAAAAAAAAAAAEVQAEAKASTAAAAGAGAAATAAAGGSRAATTAAPPSLPLPPLPLPGLFEVQAALALALGGDGAESAAGAGAGAGAGADTGAGAGGVEPAFAQRTHVLCGVSEDLAVRDFPHGHFFVAVDVDVSSLGLGFGAPPPPPSGADGPAAAPAGLPAHELIQQIFERVESRRRRREAEEGAAAAAKREACYDAPESCEA